MVKSKKIEGVECPDCEQVVNYVASKDNTWGIRVDSTQDLLYLADVEEEWCCFDCKRIYSWLDREEIW